MSPSGLDAAWGKPDPAAAYRAGVRVISLYLSWDQSKNVTPSWVKRYHAAGIAVLLNWESQPGAPLEGAARGHGDAIEAVRQARAIIHDVGYAPKNKLSISFSCDRDTSPSQYGRIDAYYANTRTVTHAAGFLNGVYGEGNLVDHLHAKGLTDFEWQTYAWSYGYLSPQADFYQFSNSHTLGGGSVDYDRVIHADQLGAWWPPNHPNNKPSGPVPPSHTEWSDMATAAEIKSVVKQALAEERTQVQHSAGVGVLYNKKKNEKGKNAYIWQHIVDAHNRMRDTVMPTLKRIEDRLTALEKKS